MSGRRLTIGAAVVAVAVVGAVIAVLVGRWERDRHVRAENAGIARVLGLVGNLDSPGLSAYRLSCATRPSSIFCPATNLDCLIYRREANPVALELCVDRIGRVVEAYDRRRAEPRIYTLIEEPRWAAHFVDRKEVDRLLVKMGGFAPLIDGVSPASGRPGTVVTITGRGFDGLREFRFGVAKAEFTVVSPREARGIVPPEAKTGPIEVRNDSGTWITEDPFVVTGK